MNKPTRYPQEVRERAVRMISTNGGASDVRSEQ